MLNKQLGGDVNLASESKKAKGAGDQSLALWQLF